MPGSPYLEESPSGLLTWQRFAIMAFLVGAVLIRIGIYFDILAYVVAAVAFIGILRYFASN